jgi:hypothetical protein
VTTGANTKLSGAVIAATDANANDTGNLNLSTGTLTTENLHDLFIRGGISKEKHMDTKTHKSNFSFLASETLQKAYKLEQKAKMPRILIDPTLVSDFNHNDEYITHFTSQLINREGNNEIEVIVEMTEIQMRLIKEKDLSVREKYQWVLDYYWTVQNNKGFNLENFTPFKPKTHHNFKWLSI